MKNNRQYNTEVVESAGGVLWNKKKTRQKIAVIYRRRYDDWSLPKGKRKTGESWEDAACREVYEETGCQPTLGEFIGSASYLVNHYRTPKVVLYWHMYPVKISQFTPNLEVDKLQWVAPQIALNLLNYENEREIIRKAMQPTESLNSYKEIKK